MKGFSTDNEAEVDVFLEFSCFLLFFYDPVDVGNLLSGSSAFSKPSLNIWKFSVYILLRHSLGNFEDYFVSIWDECNCAVVWTFPGIAFLCNWSENWPFPVLWWVLNLATLYRRSHQNHPQEKMQKGKMAVRGGLTIAEKRREAKGKGERKHIPIWMQNSKE